MSAAISILRGINVGGNRKIPMAELRQLYSELRLKNVTTYIQSGNVIFSADKINDEKLAKAIEQRILEKYNFEVPVIIRSMDEMKAVVKNNPFLNYNKIDTGKLHVTFMNKFPAKENSEKLRTYNYEPDRFTLSGKEVYIYCPDGYGNTKLNNTFFESKLKVTATTRNWRTVNELLRIASLL